MVGVSTVAVKYVAVVSTSGDPRSALAVEPDGRPIDAGVQIAAAAPRGAHTKEAEDAFRAYAKGKLPAKLIEDLVRFHRG